MSQVIALVDDDRNILTSVSIALQQEGFVTRVYSDPAAALKAIGDNPPDLGVFDIKMPGMDGMELLRRLRETSALPVIFLTSKDDETDEAMGLAMGADDYIAKPFSQRLLIARIRAILRRQELARGESSQDGETADSAPLIEHGRLVMDPDRHKVRWNGSEVSLTVTEFLILAALAQRPGVVKNRNQLLDVAYNEDVYVDDRTIDSHIKRIRRKFRALDPEFDAIETLYGVGYNSTSEEEADLALSWSGRWSLSHRILAVNILTLLLVLLSTLYLDVFRNRLSKERVRQTRLEATTAATALSHIPQAEWDEFLASIGKTRRYRIRLYSSNGSLVLDTFALGGPTFTLRDPATQSWTKDVARALDRGFNALVGAPKLDDYVEPATDRLGAWSEAIEARRSGKATTAVRNAPDLTPVISAAVPVEGNVLMVTDNDRAFTRTVRSQRAYVLAAMVAVLIISLLLSSFLARTIVRPLRRLALAAHRVRLGRSREVKVPRLPSRSDEIGLLARAVSDMSQSLRQRIDNIEAFAADVTHELKNPLASLRSAVDGLDKVEDEKLRQRLMGIARDDVRRLDRLINDIGEAARTDAELARALFDEIDVGPLIEQLVASWETRREKGDARIAFARPRKDSAVVMGKPDRLVRAINAIIDNAISFSPPGGLVEIAAARVGDEVRIRIDDEGPGVPPEARTAIFDRFHSIRPDSENFGRHSGLGLAIAQAIVKGHGGDIDVLDRDDAPSGARFIIRIPAAGRE